MRRLLPPLLGLVAACALLAACGGEEGGAGAAVPSVQDTSTASSDAGTGTADAGTGTDEDVSPKERQEAMLAFARCMRKNGVDMEDPKPGEGLALRVEKGQEKKMEKAQKACQPILRNAIGEPSAEERKAMEDSMLEFARCMREHGVQIADPKPGEGIRVGGPGTKIDPEDPTFQKAQKACEGIVRKAVKGTSGGEDDQ
jgi:hypothetical protein